MAWIKMNGGGGAPQFEEALEIYHTSGDFKGLLLTTRGIAVGGREYGGGYNVITSLSDLFTVTFTNNRVTIKAKAKVHCIFVDTYAYINASTPTTEADFEAGETIIASTYTDQAMCGVMGYRI